MPVGSSVPSGSLSISRLSRMAQNKVVLRGFGRAGGCEPTKTIEAGCTLASLFHSLLSMATGGKPRTFSTDSRSLLLFEPRQPEAPTKSLNIGSLCGARQYES